MEMESHESNGKLKPKPIGCKLACHFGPPMTLTALRVYNYIGELTKNGEHTFYISQGRIARHLGLSDRKPVNEAIGLLETHKWLARVGKRGDIIEYRYVRHLDWDTAHPEQRCDEKEVRVRKVGRPHAIPLPPIFNERSIRRMMAKHEVHRTRIESKWLEFSAQGPRDEADPETAIQFELWLNSQQLTPLHTPAAAPAVNQARPN